MTGKAEFSAEEWELLLQAPPNAGMVVITADRGGSFRYASLNSMGMRGERVSDAEREAIGEIAATLA